MNDHTQEITPVPNDPVGHFLEVAGSSAEADELVDGAREAFLSRHADSTRVAYDYWAGRLRRWMEEPESRFRLANAPEMPFDSLWPIGKNSENVITMWLIDLNLGPTDPEAFEEWNETVGPLSPSTLRSAVSALKARSLDFQEQKWQPSDRMLRTIGGVGRRLRTAYGPNRQAEPLLSVHVARIAEHLGQIDSPDAARDRLLLELHAAGVDGGGISRCRLDSVLPSHPASNSPELPDGPLDTLVVPGQNRRGGQRDPDIELSLSDRPELTSALTRYLRWRRTHDAGEELVVLGPNRSHHVRKSLGRLAEITEIDWRPRRGDFASRAEVRMMRAVLDQGVDWSAQVRRRRDHVMLLVGYLCALRRSELCALRICDIRIKEGRAFVTIVKSKGDQDQRGAVLPIARAAAGPRHLDAVTLLGEWIATLTDLGLDREAPLFPSLNRHGDFLRHRTSPDSTSAIDGQSWSDRLGELARDARVFDDDGLGRYPRVTGHSLRRGFVTSALLAGNDPVAIAKLTRHKDVGMIARYADTLHLLEKTDWTTALFGSAGGSPLDLGAALD